jgi:DNA polymerase-3 subunit chi
MALSIQFYHLTRDPLEVALPKILEKAYGQKMRVLIKTESAEIAQALSTHLWEYRQESFLPHGTVAEGQAELQPILLSPELKAMNGANLWVVTDGTEITPGTDGVTRVLDMFNGLDDTATAAARARWKSYKDAGLELSYFKQTESGGWEKAA